MTLTCTCRACGCTWAIPMRGGARPLYCAPCRRERGRARYRRRRRIKRAVRPTDWPLDRCGHDVRVDTWSLVSRVRCRECGVTELRGGA